MNGWPFNWGALALFYGGVPFYQSGGVPFYQNTGCRFTICLHAAASVAMSQMRG